MLFTGISLFSGLSFLCGPFHCGPSLCGPSPCSCLFLIACSLSSCQNPSLAVGSSVSSSVVQGSLVHSPGALVRSSGSMVNQYGLEEEEEEEEEEARGGVPTRDLFVTVDHPESHVTAIETFIVYRVLARPLPEKFVMKGLVERFSEDFIETRRRALQTFLSKTAEHPMLSRSPQLKVFLTEQDLTAIKKQGPSFLSRMGDSVRAAAIAVRGVRARPQEFGAMQDYADEFSCKMSALDKVTQRIIKEQNEYLEELSQYGPLYSQWAELEADLSEPLRGVAGCLDLCGRETEEQLRHLTEVLQPTLHQYLLCADTLKTVLRRRDHIQAEFEAKNDALASSAVSKKGDLETLKEEAAGLEERVESANSALKGDWARWGDAMRYDLREALVSTADKNQDYYEKCLAVWETFLLSQKTPPGQEED
uniref:Sorting nexin 7 n=1 Tax=Gadus morhua TaxID=8049 RepID=A0A8C5CQ08_GADMO